MSRFVNPVPQFYLNNGDIASSGKLYFYETGTTTKKDTFSNFGQTVKNTNPVILSGEGRCPNIFGSGRYTVVFRDADDIQQWTRDDVELSVELGQYADWSPILTYRVNDIVRGPDGNYYRSITSTNTGNNPTTSDENWERIGFITFWNTNATYGNGDLVVFGGALYRSGEDENQGNQPDQSSTTVWGNTVEPSPWRSGISYQSGELVIYEAAIYRSSSNDNQGNQPDASNQWSNVFGEFPLVELPGGTTTLTSNFNGTYWWGGEDGHTVTVGQQSSDEGATVTRLICRSGSDSNLTLNLASGVTANWSFDESESADGYEIKPGEIVELVKVGTNSYVAYAPNGISEVIELGGDFDSGVEVKASRIGPSVTIVNNSNLSHAPGSSASSSAGAIPSLYRPQDYGGINMGSRNLYYSGPSTITMVEVSTDGQLTISYRDYSGGTSGASSSSRMTISYLA